MTQNMDNYDKSIAKYLVTISIFCSKQRSLELYEQYKNFTMSVGFTHFSSEPLNKRHTHTHYASALSAKIVVGQVVGDLQ